jgi:hypothetical protein
MSGEKAEEVLGVGDVRLATCALWLHYALPLLCASYNKGLSLCGMQTCLHL